MKFKQIAKIYLFKDTKMVDISIRTSENHVIGYELPVDQFQELMNKWRDPDGVTVKSGHSTWYVQHKHQTSRTERLPTSFVRISVSICGLKHHHRIPFNEMVAIEREFFYQKHNRMHWDA